MPLAQVRQLSSPDRYSIIKQLGEGAFGTVCLARDINFDNVVAVKMEPRGEHLLQWEKRAYDKVVGSSYPIGIPRPLGFFRTPSNNVLVMPLLGKSLRDLFLEKGCFPLKSICHLAIQMLNRLQHVHERGLLHLDIKPDNMMVGKWMDKGTVYLIDFGLSKPYIDRHGTHIPFHNDVGFCGTPVFSSLHVDEREQRSPRDDLESLFFSLMILHRGALPWCNGFWDESSNIARYWKSKKRDGRHFLASGLPREVERAWWIISSMQFGDTPRYDLLRSLFTTTAQECQGGDIFRFRKE